MTQRRLSAWEQYLASPLTQSHWGLPLDQIRPYTEPPRTPIPSEEWPKDLQHALEERGDEEGLIVQRDSTILSRSITKEQAKKGVIFTDLDTAIKTVPDLVHKHFARLVRPDQPMAAMHTALWSGGTFLYVPEYLDVELPFHTCYWMTHPWTAMFPHTLIVLEKGSRVSFTDEYLSNTWTEPGLSLGVTEAVVGEGACLNYFNVQNWGQRVYHHLTTGIETATEGRVISYHLDMGGRTPKNRLDASQMQGSQVTSLSGAYLEDAQGLEETFCQIPVSSIAEKMRHYIEGWITGHRPSLTLERVAQLHPEVRV
jgi:Fe-S cluster assembly scaffold protein SufB